MKKSINTLFTLTLIFNILSAFAQDKHQKMEPLVNVHWLKDHLYEPEIIILDASVIASFNEEGQFNMTSGKDKYDNSHIPNASFADLLGNLSATDTDLRFVMPSPQQFNTALNGLGINNDSKVVIYSSDPGQGWSQRLWWMLHWVGHENVAILDGGFKAWLEADYPVSNKPVNRTKTHYKLNLRNQVIADRNEVYNAINTNDITIVDVMPEASFNGEFSMYARPGHIKSAINIPTESLVTDSGHYKADTELESLFESNKKNRIITYCGGGVSASSMAFTLHRLGYQNVAVYMGSLQEWTKNEENPMSIEH